MTDMEVLQALHMEHRARVAACIDHDLAGPQGGGFVFADCRKCGGRFKVEIEDLDVAPARNETPA